ncbi:response regulator [Mesoterricola sediminis]|uniref:Response regulatory domain-containing protein n=1 Tax=Mesoterricola sediminis TaxID=2927980 RepID=A0AA48KCL0_9BACT|nr:response regulator [Mesoterricola sediminis]BDU76160.1 hypothetical protein METESE_11180 [Mesoterricola sediminis]
MRGPVLIVDDEEDFRELLVDALASLGYRVFGAETAEAALAGWEGWKPAVVVTDQNMPGGKSGLELLAYLRERAPAVPCILMTGYASEELARKAQRLGVFDFLRKPFKLTDFETSLARACRWAEDQGAPHA